MTDWRRFTLLSVGMPYNSVPMTEVTLLGHSGNSEAGTSTAKPKQGVTVTKTPTMNHDLLPACYGIIV